MSFQCLRLTPDRVSGNSELPNKVSYSNGFPGYGKKLADQKNAYIGYILSDFSDNFHNRKQFARPGTREGRSFTLAGSVQAAFAFLNPTK